MGLLDPPAPSRGQLTTSTRQARTAAAGEQFRARAHARARAAFDESTPTQVIEPWTDLTAWTATGTPVQVSGGRLYSTGTGGASSGANRSVSLRSDERMRAVFVLNQVSGGSSGYMIVGATNDTAGAAPSASGASMFGIGLPANSTGQVRKYSGSGGTTDLATGAATGTWIATLIADATYLTITVRLSDGSVEHRARWLRSSVNINNLGVFMSDTRTTTGQSIGRVAMRRAVATISPRVGVEDQGTTVYWSQVAGTAAVRVALPAGYDSRVPCPAVLMFHGGGSDETHWVDNSNGRQVANAFLAAGYITIGATYGTNLTTYGADISLDAYVTAFMQAAQLFNIGPVVIYANSMGGIESLLTLASGRIPGVVAWTGSVPTASLDAAWNFTPGYLDRTAEIKTAYGIASDGSDYATKTAGHDPMLLDPTMFGGVPMFAVVATDDAAVDPSRNWNAFAPRVAPYSVEMQRFDVTGGHSSSSIGANAARFVAFANRYTGLG